MAKQQVLIVDDDKASAIAVAETLRRRFKTTVVTDPRKALDLLSDPNHPYALVISDYRMPGMNGVQLAQAARQIKLVPFLIRSGTSEKTIASESPVFRDLHLRYISKVSDRETFFDEIELALSDQSLVETKALIARHEGHDPITPHGVVGGGSARGK